MGTRTKNSGRVLLVLLLVTTLALGLSVWKYESNKAAKRAELDRIELAEREASARAENERRRAEEEYRRVDAERLALVRAQQDEKAKADDALRASYKALADVTSRWSDALRVAGAASRIALAGPMATLQAIRRDAEALSVPNCAVEAKRQLLRSMNASIEGMLMFMTDSKGYSLEVQAALFRTATEAMEEVIKSQGVCPKL